MHQINLRKKFYIIIAVVISLCINCISIAAPIKNTEYILITGFEPFGEHKTNSSWEAVRHLQGKQFSHKTILVAQLPTVWEEAGKKLQVLIQKYHPVAVIAFGQAGKEPVRIELIAKNLRENIKDNHAAFPTSLLISKSAPATFKTTLDIRAIMQHLRQAEIPVVESSDAGRYLCNETFFILMSDPGAQWALKIPRGFVHVPSLNASVVTAKGYLVLFDAKKLEKTATIVVKAVAQSLSEKKPDQA